MEALVIRPGLSALRDALDIVTAGIAMKHWFEHILQHGVAQPETPAIVLLDRVVTYGMLRGAIERCAQRIHALGLPQAKHVAVLIESPLRHLVISLALYRIGIPSLPLEHGFAGLRGLGLEVVLGDAAAGSLVDPASRFVFVDDDWFGAEPALPVSPPPSFSNGRQVCRHALTSGSTGAPKLIAYTVAETGARIAEKIQLDILRSRRLVLCMPGLSSDLGYTTACATLAAGRTLCFAESPAHAVRMIELFSIDLVRTSTEQLLALTRAAKHSGSRLDSLGAVISGGGSPSRALLEQALTHLCRNIHCSYGSSETGRMAMADARDVLAKPGLVGWIVPGVEVAILDDSGARCPPGTVGAIAIRKALHEDADATSPTEWRRLGDMGWLDSDGRLFVVGRSSDGSKPTQQISPALEAEHLLLLEWDIRNAAAVLIDDPVTPDKAEIWVGLTKRGEADADVLAGMLRARGIDCAVRFIDISVVPCGANGKVQRGPLKSLLQAASIKVQR